MKNTASQSGKRCFYLHSVIAGKSFARCHTPALVQAQLPVQPSAAEGSAAVCLRRCRPVPHSGRAGQHRACRSWGCSQANGAPALCIEPVPHGYFRRRDRASRWFGRMCSPAAAEPPERAAAGGAGRPAALLQGTARCSIGRQCGGSLPQRHAGIVAEFAQQNVKQVHQCSDQKKPPVHSQSSPVPIFPT